MPKARKKTQPTPLVRRWRVALAEAGLDQETWATAHGWTAGHVQQVIAGKRESSQVTASVTEFIEEQERALTARIQAAAAA
ncbi:MAG: hypothetical protein HEQ38_17130 [Gemmatimonas sp.]|nr:hypothetical protein [Gemmatimonas sp.]